MELTETPNIWIVHFDASNLQYANRRLSKRLMQQALSFHVRVHSAGYRWASLVEMTTASLARTVVSQHSAGRGSLRCLKQQAIDLNANPRTAEAAKSVRGGDVEIRNFPAWNAAGSDTPRLILLPARDDEQSFNTHEPLADDSGLFRNFANLDPTPVSVLDFANRHGLLFGFSSGEPFSEWEFEIRTLRFVISVWDAVRSGRRTAVIDRYFKPSSGGDRIRYPFAFDILMYRSYRSQTKFSKHRNSSHGKPLDVARDYLIHAINIHLEENGITTALTKVNDVVRLAMQPSNLLGAIWAQFAVAVSEGKQHRACGTCGTFFELEPDLNRTSRWYCSDACRVKTYRDRKAKALRLHMLGKSLKQIAIAVESDVTTVRGWLKPKEM